MSGKINKSNLFALTIVVRGWEAKSGDGRDDGGESLRIYGLNELLNQLIVQVR